MTYLVKKAGHMVVLVIFIIFAYLQLNDPDPVAWTTFYCLGAVPSILAIFGKSYQVVNWVIFGIAITVAVFFVSGFNEYLGVSNTEPLMQGMNPDKPFIEEAREFIGALIAALLILPYIIITRFSGKAKARKKSEAI